ncbi:MAG: hypothetical protein AAGG46_12735, partial [Planctomycetota bacterium]
VRRELFIDAIVRFGVAPLAVAFGAVVVLPLSAAEPHHRRNTEATPSVLRERCATGGLVARRAPNEAPARWSPAPVKRLVWITWLFGVAAERLAAGFPYSAWVTAFMFGGWVGGAAALLTGVFVLPRENQFFQPKPEVGSTSID